MSVPTMDSFKTVLRFLTNQKSTIGYSFMAIFTIGSERIFSMVSFQCPCNREQNFVYGVTFLLGPAIVFMIISLFVSTRFWRLYTGCCLNPFKLCPKGNCLSCLTVFIKVLAGACIAPIMWLCVALLNGTFYECAVSGLDKNMVVDLFCKNKTPECREELAQVPCSKSQLSPDDNKELLLMLRAQSQILGWSIVIFSAIAALIGTCFKNCRSQVSYLQLTFWKIYMQKEKEKFETFAEDYATKLAERNLKSFFDNKSPEPFSFPNHKAWEEISSIYTFTQSEQYYSNLQRYVECGDRDYSPEKHPVLQMEDGIEMV
ncbi:calcium homeostasis modulator protein 5-like [Myxocyprinus asiaticus]|uniref:calcium homeostasis modulator protein 5-like n=1 Tax=Myxocyprinus asiaticus TaxID=70543 RepID=UPI002221FF5F|nr:calcium homeostasis modulator protein 5-like [Myxocyprinus asiaticus]